MVTPSIHINGTSRDELQDQLRDAAAAVNEAITKVIDACPNARDYYVQGPGAYATAIQEYTSRVDRLRSVYHELLDIYEAIA